MKSNPFEPPSTEPATTAHAGKKRRRLFITGTICIASASIGVLFTIVGMMRAFSQLARAEAVSPSDLADGIGTALIPSYIGAALGVVGVVLMVLGRSSRR